MLDFLRRCHRSAPFLFFNGNTFAEIARRTVDILLFDLPATRAREAASLAAHYVAGVLEREPMVGGLTALIESADFAVGDRVRSFRGSLRGDVMGVLPDGRLRLRTESGTELEVLPESVLKESAQAG